MDFNRKALGLAIGSIAAVALSVTAMTASAMDLTGARYYAADDSAASTDSAKDTREHRNAEHRHHRHHEKLQPKDGSSTTYTKQREETGDERNDQGNSGISSWHGG